MKLGFTKVTKRMRVCFDVKEFDGGAYFFEDGLVVGKLIDGEILQLVVQDGDVEKLLVLARNIKRKCGQELTIADMVFVDLFQDNKLVKCVKKRQFKYAESIVVETCGVKAIGLVNLTDNGMKIEVPKLAVNEEFSGMEDFDGRQVHILNSRTKQIKQYV